MRKIENLLLIPVVALVLIAHFSDATFDIHIHDTYYVIPINVYAMLLAFILVFAVSLYQAIQWRQTIDRNWSWVHIGVSIIMLAAFLIYMNRNDIPPNSYEGYAAELLKGWERYNRSLLSTLSVFAMAQLVFLVYFIVRVLKKPANLKA